MSETDPLTQVLEPWVASLWKPLQMLLQPANGDDTIKAS